MLRGLEDPLWADEPDEIAFVGETSVQCGPREEVAVPWPQGLEVSERGEAHHPLVAMDADRRNFLGQWG